MAPVSRDSQTLDSHTTPPLLAGERVALVGRLAGMGRREVVKLIRRAGGTVVEEADTATLVVVGEVSAPSSHSAETATVTTKGTPTGGESLTDEIRRAAAAGRLAILDETELWQRLGLVDGERDIQGLYTPAMLADLIDVPITLVRRWHRKGLIVAKREVRRLPYFDFQEIATARRLAQLLKAGCSPPQIERKLAEFERSLPGIERPLAFLPIVVEGKRLLVRQDERLVDLGGQLRFDFDAPPEDLPEDLVEPEPLEASSPEAILDAAGELEEQGRWNDAAEMYRAALAAAGPKAELNFLLAELLYRMGELAAARERYYSALEIDEDYVEARANLGCVLAELGQRELAVAAFRGALASNEEYPDVHYHLAHTLDELKLSSEAEEHWRAFLELAPDSPWADEARVRLGEAD